MRILDRVRDTIRRYSMLRGGERVLVALSGGPDSVCLLLLLNELRDELRITLSALYVDHGLRPGEVPSEIVLCRELTTTLGIPLNVLRVDVRGFAEDERLGIQEAARLLRYRAFYEEARRLDADRVATGHHADDQAETVIMRLLRGSGPRGLSGIPPVRESVIRPMIGLRREEIEGYLRERDIRFVHDSSNLQDKYLRNRIRRELLPALKRYNPRIVEVLGRTADILREEDGYMEIKVTKALMRLITKKTGDTVELFLSPLENMEKVILRRVLLRIVEETRGLRGIGLEHVEAIMGLIRAGSAGSRVYLPRGVRAIKGYSTLTVTSVRPGRLPEYTLNIPGETVLKEAGIVLIASMMETKEAGSFGDGRNEAVFDPDTLVFPLKVRARRPGDAFYPYGFGKRKKIQDFFVDGKVPRDERDTVPLLLSGDDIIWVVGYRTDDRYRVGSACRRVLKIMVRLVNR
ncbi:MAG TPA: tRNA lysidine(34) synthetase TilS [Nitrospirae bacterium]|nr:tRNA lysidine(34) synthetase TilS [Nitrospirota bacterium]